MNKGDIAPFFLFLLLIPTYFIFTGLKIIKHKHGTSLWQAGNPLQGEIGPSPIDDILKREHYWGETAVMFGKIYILFGILFIVFILVTGIALLASM